MEAFFEENTKLDNGVVYPFYSSIQEGFGNDKMVSAHWHDYIEILYCLSGTIKVLLGNSDYLCSKGDMILINSREIHSVVGHTFNDKIRYIVLKLNPEMLYTTHNSILEMKYILPFIMSESTHEKVFTSCHLENSHIPYLLHEIVKEYENKRYGFELAIHTHVCGIFLWILRTWHDKCIDLNIDFHFNEETIDRLQKIFDYVDTSYKEQISVEIAADLCNMSYSYFSRFFKSTMNRNFSEYVNYIRINKAAELLTTTPMNITEISQEVGFSSSSYFIQQFKLYKKISPKQYRNHLKESL